MYIQFYYRQLFSEICNNPEYPENVVCSPPSDLLTQSMLVLGAGDDSDEKSAFSELVEVAADELD